MHLKATVKSRYREQKWHQSSNFYVLFAVPFDADCRSSPCQMIIQRHLYDMYVCDDEIPEIVALGEDTRKYLNVVGCTRDGVTDE